MKRFIYLILMLTLLLAACGGGDEPAAEVEEAPAEVPTAAAVAEAPETAEVDEPEAAVPTEESDASEADSAADTTDTNTASADSSADMITSITLDKSAYETGEAIAVSLVINSPVEDDAWVGIVPSDTPHGSEADNDLVDVTYAYLSQMEDGQIILTAPVEAGYFDVRLFDTDMETGVELASTSITVGDVSSLTIPVIGGEDNGSAETGTEGSENSGTEESEGTAETTTAGNGGADCLVGTWRVTNFDDYFAAIVQEAMAGTGQTMEITSTSSGDLLLAFDGTNMTMSDNNFQVIVTVAGQTVPVDIQAAGSATYTVEDGILTGQIGSVNVDDTNTGLGYGVSNIVGQPISFSCEGDSLSWLDQNGYTVMLSRVN